MSETKKRLDYVDVYRGTGILLMVMAHIGFGSVFDHFIHAFHMPMFFFASGYFFRNDEAKSFFPRKAKALLRPYLVYSFFVALLWWRLFREPDCKEYVRLLFHMNDGSFIIGAIWFLPALFFADAMYWGIRKYFKDERAITLTVVVLALAGNLYHVFFANLCILSLDTAAVGVGMMHAGHLLKSNALGSQKLLSLSPLQTVMVGAAIVGLIFVNSPVNMREGKYGFIPLFWLNAVGASVVLWNASRLLFSFCTKSGSVLASCCTVIRMIGQRSLTFLCLNQLAIYAAFRLIPLRGSGSVSVLLHNLLVLFFVLAVLYLIAEIKQKMAMEIVACSKQKKGNR